MPIFEYLNNAVDEENAQKTVRFFLVVHVKVVALSCSLLRSCCFRALFSALLRSLRLLPSNTHTHTQTLTNTTHVGEDGVQRHLLASACL